MAMCSRPWICLAILFLMGWKGYAQTNREEETQSFILEAMANYKNPMAYYPIRRDIFLPSSIEIDSLDNVMDDYSAPHLSYQFLFLSKNDTLKREIFLDASGKPLFKISFGRAISSQGGLEYLQRRQSRLLNASPDLGKFLLFNEKFKKSYQPQQH